MPDSLYDRDFYAWTQEQARLLRDRAELLPNDPVDWAHLAEEVEDMGKAIASSVRSCYARILEHLLKLEHSSRADPRGGWIDSVDEHRLRIPQHLRDSPGLKPRLDALFAEAWQDARRAALLSFRRHEPAAAGAVPERCPYGREQAEDEDWFPPNRHGLG